MALAAVATGALVVIASEQRAQVSIARHEQCISDAQNRHGGDGFQGPLDRAPAACYRDPSLVLTNQQPISTPGLVTVRFSEAKRDLATVGLQAGSVTGSTDPDAIVTSQEPVGGESEPAGSSVDLWTRAP